MVTFLYHHVNCRDKLKFVEQFLNMMLKSNLLKDVLGLHNICNLHNIEKFYEFKINFQSNQ